MGDVFRVRSVKQRAVRPGYAAAVVTIEWLRDIGRMIADRLLEPT